jgi:hypothetical protein
MFKISLNRIHDKVRITEGDEHLELRVDGDPMRMVAGLNEAQRRLKTITEDMPESEQNEIAGYFAGVIFGAEQAKALAEFYHDDVACIINICGQYFRDRLAGLIAKAQKKLK